MRNKLKWLLLVVVWLGIYIWVDYLMDKESQSCNRVIFLKGELSRDINYINYISNGNIAQIYYCDGTTEEISTSRIIKVVQK